jgi:hypothetical protein
MVSGDMPGYSSFQTLGIRGTGNNCMLHRSGCLVAKKGTLNILFIFLRGLFMSVTNSQHCVGIARYLCRKSQQDVRSSPSPNKDRDQDKNNFPPQTPKTPNAKRQPSKKKQVLVDPTRQKDIMISFLQPSTFQNNQKKKKGSINDGPTSPVAPDTAQTPLHHMCRGPVHSQRSSLQHQLFLVDMSGSSGVIIVGIVLVFSFF